MPKQSKVSLADYAKTRSVKTGTLCTVCNLPQVDEINTAMKNGVGTATILKWLSEELEMEGVTEGHVAGHRRRKHFNYDRGTNA
jgi:hypothetical protein